MDQKEITLPHSVRLGKPLTWGSETREEIVILRGLKAKDFKGIKAGDIAMDDMLRMISKISSEPLALIEELEAVDLFKLVEVLNSFLPSGLATGGKL